ncbi:MAG: coproporphyrinogen III oxidase [Zetaproteobacteria bacterium]|nr:MAG: coproporphyrinogen III oxidase [Zetaproteobacteria bacterium]
MGVYIHWPFCAAKCPYCDFNSHVRGHFEQKEWADAYVKSLEYYAELLPDKQVVSIFFGGGTPSLMAPETVQVMIDAVQRLWPAVNDVEITLEANPTSVEIGKFKAFKEAGVTRISLGVQAFNDRDLKFLGREHSVDEALKAIEIAGECFERYSFDLIYGRPDQSLTEWEGELTQALPYARGHLSLYQLTIERNTPFHMLYHRGAFSIPDDVVGAEFYHLTQDILGDAGMPRYEVSNHAQDGHECRHNLVYWHMVDYIGVGAGAHGRFMNGGEKYASRDHSAPEIWLKRVQEKGLGAHEFEKLSQEDRLVESLMMGLRLRGGVSMRRCEALSGLDFMSVVDHDKLKTICDEGWGQVVGDQVSLTREGILRLNAIIPFILQ